jgi:uncharacterized protein (DUF305 family)
MKSTHPFSRMVLCMGLSVLGSLAAGTAVAQGASSPMAKPMTAMDSGPSKELQAAMMSGMDPMKSMTMSGDVDKDFAMMMKLHHQQAIAMAKPEAEHGKSPEMKAMARKVIKDQTKEIAQLDAWLKKHP